MIEVVQDAKAGTATLYVFNGHQESRSITKAPALLIPGHSDPIVATGKADVWVFTDDLLKKHPHGMRVRITVDGKEFNPDWHPPH